MPCHGGLVHPTRLHRAPARCGREVELAAGRRARWVASIETSQRPSNLTRVVPSTSAKVRTTGSPSSLHAKSLHSLNSTRTGSHTSQLSGSRGVQTSLAQTTASRPTHTSLSLGSTHIVAYTRGAHQSAHYRALSEYNIVAFLNSRSALKYSFIHSSCVFRPCTPAWRRREGASPPSRASGPPRAVTRARRTQCRTRCGASG